jgi:hypothetical protein
MAQTTEHLFFMHDGAKHHTSQATKQFLAVHRARITLEPLPSYSPDDNPIEYLWKKTKQRATHNQYFKEFVELTVSVDKALAFFATHSNGGLRAVWVLLQRKRLGPSAGRIGFQKQTRTSIDSVRLLVEWAAHGFRATIQDMSRDHGGLHVLMPEQFLHGPNIVAGFQQLRGERVAVIPHAE